MLDGELDVGYFDSFSSPEDMAKYAEVFKKQQDVDAVQEKGRGGRNAWVGFTFGRNANVSYTFIGLSWQVPRVDMMLSSLPSP